MLDDIVLFLKIVKLGSFRKVADSSRLSLSTVSKRISTLEDRLGNRLMLRDAKSINLTDYGKVIYAKFQSLLMFSNKIEHIGNSSKTQEDEIEGCVTICLGVHIAQSLINKHLKSFLEFNPTLKLNIIYQLEPDSAKNNVNITLTPKFSELKGYKTRLLRDENLQFYCSKNYAKLYGVPQTIAELSQCKLIGGLSEDHQQVDNITLRNMITNERALLSTGYTQLKINSPSFMKTIGINSDAIFPCWASLCKEDLVSGQIVRVLPDWVIYTHQFYLITKEYPSPTEQLVINFLAECCSEPSMMIYSPEI